MSDQPMVPDTIRLTGISATGYHGVFDHERRAGQTFVVDLIVDLDTRRAAATDDLAHTLDYGAVAEQVVGVLRGEPAALIETVAERIAATVLAYPQVQGVEVTVHKPQAPIPVPFADVEVRVRRDRNWLPAAEPLAAHAQPWQPEQVASGQPWVPEPVAEPVWAPPAAVPVAAGLPPTGNWAPVLPEDVAPTTGQSLVVGEPAAAALAGLTGLSAPTPVVTAAEQVPAGDQFDLAPDEPAEVVLALGSNLGATQDTLRSAVADVAAIPGVELLDVSALARTAPVGGPQDQPDFLNAVLIARTTLAPRALLHATAAIEQQHGRERGVHWGPRTLDIDIIAFGELSLVTDDLELPHPRAHERAFVLQPWAQIRPDAVLHGLGGGPVAQLAATAPDRDGVRWLALDWLEHPVPAALDAEPFDEEPEPDPVREHPALFDVRSSDPQSAPDDPAARYQAP